MASKSLTPHSSSAGKVQQELNTRKGTYKQRSSRKYAIACRRLRTESSGANTKDSGTQTEAAAPIMSRNGTHGLPLQNLQHPQGSKQSLPASITAGRTASVNPNSAQLRQHHAVQPHVQLPLHSSYPPHTPAYPQLRPYPYGTYSAPVPYTLYHPTLTGQYGPAVCNLQPFPTSTSSVQTEGRNTRLGSLQSCSDTRLPRCVPEVQQPSGTLASKSHPHFRFEGNTGKGGSPQAGLSNTRTASRTEVNQLVSNSTVGPTTKLSQPVQNSIDAATAELESNTVHPLKASTTPSTSQEIQLLMQEMFSSFQLTVGRIRGSVRTGMVWKYMHSSFYAVTNSNTILCWQLIQISSSNSRVWRTH